MNGASETQSQYRRAMNGASETQSQYHIDWVSRYQLKVNTVALLTALLKLRVNTVALLTALLKFRVVNRYQKKTVRKIDHRTSNIDHHHHKLSINQQYIPYQILFSHIDILEKCKYLCIESYCVVCPAVVCRNFCCCSQKRRCHFRIKLG